MRFEIFQSGGHSVGGQFYWRLRAANGRIISDGSEGYSSKSNVKRAIKNIRHLAAAIVSCSVEDDVQDPVTETFESTKAGKRVSSVGGVVSARQLAALAAAADGADDFSKQQPVASDEDHE